MSLYHAFFATVAIVVTILIYFRPRPLVRRATVQSINDLLNPPTLSIRSQLRSRAIPNERLVRAFHLTNTFVSSDTGVHSRFQAHAKSLLKDSLHRGWPYFLHVSTQAVNASLPETDIKMPFDKFVQAVTLRVVLVGFLNVDQDAGELDSDDINVVASLITELWALSKRKEFAPPNLIPPHHLTQLNERIRLLVPDHELYPNPLDFVIPAWETLWRVVATSLAHVHSDLESRQSFAALYDLPTTHQFRSFPASGPSVESVVTEAMRLHPPSKHISRAIFETRPFRKVVKTLPFISQYFHGDVFRVEKAAIEAIQLAPDIWGLNAAEFDPMRHTMSRMQPDQADSLLAFGCGPLQCIAKSWAPMAAGLIAAAIFDRVDQVGYSVVEGGRIGGREGWDGWMVTKIGSVIDSD